MSREFRYKGGRLCRQYCWLLLCIVVVLLNLAPLTGASGACDCQSTALTPSSGYVGSVVYLSISDSDFLTAGDYELVWSPTPVFTGSKVVVVKSGAVSQEDTSININFIVPESTYSMHYIQFRKYRRAASFQFFVRPSLTIDSLPVSAGKISSITGRGFPPGAPVSLLLDGKATGVSVNTSDLGSFTAEYMVPQMLTGDHEISCRIDYFQLSAAVMVNILPAVKAAHGEKIKEAGGSPVPVVDADVTGPVKDIKAVELSAPVIIKPSGRSYGLIGTQSVAFRWQAPVHAGRIIYNLQVSHGQDFAEGSLIYNESGLSGTECTVRLDPGEYFWRIMAEDESGNQSGWVETPGNFAVSTFSIQMDKFFKWMQEVNLLRIAGLFVLALMIIRIIVMVVEARPKRRRRYYR